MKTTKNYLLTDKVEIEGGTGLNFTLVLDEKDPKTVCEKEYDEIPTWEQLTNDLIKFCKDENICLSYLAEQGTIQQGETRSVFAPCAIELIAKNLVS